MTARFVEACVDRARLHAEETGGALDRYAASALALARKRPSIAPFVAAGCRAGLGRPDAYAEGVSGERAWQSGWVAERFGLTSGG